MKSYETVKGHEISNEIFELIKKDHPEFTSESSISIDHLNQYRRQYLANLLEEEKGELETIDVDVIEAFKGNSTFSKNIKTTLEAELTTGQKLADKIAEFGGSWTFIIAFFSFIVIWMIINVIFLVDQSFDPYPFILLNLILSCLAAIQAPIIMMSQNRQEEKDRQRAEHDYKVDLKAELEIKLLSEKIDHLLAHQNKKLLNMQQVQIDYLENLMKKLNKE